jgi:hypothetical protein
MKQKRVKLAELLVIVLNIIVTLPACSNQASSLAVGTMTAGKPFIHPGLLHTEADFSRMKAKVEAKEQPCWMDGTNSSPAGMRN